MTKKEIKTKKRLHYFTLESNVEKSFEKFIEENLIDKTKLLERIIIQYLEKNNIKIDD